MPFMPLSQTRVQDQVLTNLSQGYSNMEYVGKYLFPMVPVGEYGGEVVLFDDAIYTLQDFTRAPGSVYKRVHRSYASDSFKLEHKGAEFPVPFEHVTDAARLGFQWDNIAADSMMMELGLELEVDQASLATNAANYPTANKETLSGTSQWSNSASTPNADIREAKAAVRRATGKNPNLVLLGGDVYDKLQEHPSLVDRFKYTSSDVVTGDMLARLWDVEKVVIGKAIYNDPATGDRVDVWGKYAIVAYVNPAALASGMLSGFQISGNVNRFTPGFAYTYTMQGHPYQKPVWRDESRDCYIYQTKFDRVPVLAGLNSGFLFSDAVA